MARLKEAYTGKLNVRQYSDTELRSVALSTDDPISLGTMSDQPPRHDEDLEFVAQYTSGETLVCAFGHHHKRGFLLKGEDDLHHLIGKDCAAEHYGLEWDAFVKSVKTSVDRQRSLRWLHEVSQRILDSGEELEAIVKSPSVAAFDALRVTIRGLPGDIYDAFHYSAKELDTWMRSTFCERDLREERRRKEKAYETWQASLKDRDIRSSERNRLKREWEKAEKASVYSRVTKPILRCPARSLFVGGKMALRLGSIHRDLMAQATNLQGSQRWHPDMVARSLSETAKQFDAIIAELTDAVNLFSPDTLDCLKLLFSGEEYHTLIVERLADGLSFEPRRGTAVVLRRPQDLKPLAFSLYDRLRL